MITGASTALAASMIARACSMLLMLNAGTPYPCSAAWSRSCRSVMRAIFPSFSACYGPDDRHFLGSERFDAGQGLALEPFQEGAAGRRDVGEAVGHAGMVERRDRVAAARDRDELAGRRALRRMAGRGHRALIERRDLERAERSVPHQRRGVVDRRLDALHGLRADVEDHAVGG